MKIYFACLIIGLMLSISNRAIAQDNASKQAIDILDEALSKSQASSTPPSSSRDNGNDQPDSQLVLTAEDYYDRAGDWYRKKQYDKAIEDFSKAIELNSDYAIAYHGRGSSWAKIRQYDKAISDMTKSIELEPDGLTYYDRGVSWAKIKQLDKAVKDFNKAIELNPGDAFLYAALAFFWNDNGSTSKAKGYASKAKQLDPSIKVPEF